MIPRTCGSDTFDEVISGEVTSGEIHRDKYREDRPCDFANGSFFRKGEIRDWHNYWTPEMAARTDGLMEEKFNGTGLLEHCE
ncbi:unnamed protein product [Cochlearia groenlandica]